MNASSMRRRWLLFGALSLILLVACVAFYGLGARRSDAQRLMQKLDETAHDGCPVEELLASVGEPDQILSGDQAPKWLVEASKRNYPDGDVRPTDKFLVYDRTHNDRSSRIVYLQVRDGRLINVDSEFPDPDTEKTYALY